MFGFVSQGSLHTKANLTYNLIMISQPYGGQKEHNWILQNVTKTHLLIMLSLPTPT